MGIDLRGDIAFQTLCWLGAINLLLFIRVLRKTPRAMELGAEAQHMKEQASLLRAQVEEERLRRGIPDNHAMREQRYLLEAQIELEKVKQGKPSCAGGETS